MVRERDFTGSASHELRTPITVITGAIERLEQDDLSAEDVAPFSLLLPNAILESVICFATLVQTKQFRPSLHRMARQASRSPGDRAKEIESCARASTKVT